MALNRNGALRVKIADAKLPLLAEGPRKCHPDFHVVILDTEGVVSTRSMRRLTFGAVLNSDLPKKVGLCAQDRTEVANIVNACMQRLLIDPMAPDEGWWSGWATMLFNLTVTNHVAYFRTPQEIARVIVLDVCNRPRFIRNGFYEYLQFGTGHRPRGCNSNCCDTQQAYDRPDVATLVPFPTSIPQGLRIYPTDAADVGKRVVVQGPDANGIPVLGTDPTTGGPTSGETVFLTLPFVTTVNQWQDITGLIKDPTNGPVKFFTVDPSTGVQTELSAMDPNETTASYRQYLVGGLPTHCCNTPNNTVQVYAQAKLDFQPVSSSTDYCIINNLEALKEEAQAYRYSSMDNEVSAQLEQKHHTAALRLLCGQLDNYEGKVRTAISVPIFGSDRARLNPV